MPFPITLYNQTFTTAQVSAKGYMSFGATNDAYQTTCLPADTMTYAILPFWSDQNTAAPGKGIYTLVSGTAPNRTFYVEWRNCGYGSPTTCYSGSDFNYEVIFQEGQTSFQVVYGSMGSNSFSYFSLGVQKDQTLYTQASCITGAAEGDRLTYSTVPIVCPTNTPIPTATATVATSTPTITPSPYPTQPPCATGWRATPRQGSGRVNSVYATASGDAWAAGDDGILHWNGTQWVIVAPTGGYHDIEVVGPNDAWGIYTPVTGISDIGHWNGTAWSVSPYPAPAPSGCCTFNDLSAWSPTDIWVVGYWQNFDQQWILFHWNGSVWHREQPMVERHASPDHPDGGGFDWYILERVAAVGPGEMWAYGYATCSFVWCYNGPIAAHPCLAGCATGTIQTTAEFKGGALISAADRWAVAGSGIYHWNGTAWTSQSHPDVGSLTSIAASGPNDAWASGPGGIVHWDGSAWAQTYSPGGATDLASGRLNDAWAARGADILHYPGFQLFTDVPPGNTFYIHINNLACLGVISGYTTGCETGAPCFKPGNNVTRGQLSKIVSIAAGFTEPPGAQLFEDIAPGSTFYDYIYRLATRTIINGYPCGGPGEPCGAGNKPYFRPNNNASRGQISKIVANAAGFVDPPGAQIFEDVPPTSSFFDFIQRLANRGVMSGYPCGGPGEPCGVGNKPYFRPGNNATRGQLSKIVHNAITEP